MAQQQQITHVLDKYKRLLEVYDLSFVKTQERPEGKLILIDRASGREVSDGVLSREEKSEIMRRLAFAKSWVKACGKDLALTGSKNSIGYDERQWEYSFNDGAKETFDTLIKLLATNTNPNLNTNQIIENVSSSTSYKYANSICNGLLDKNNITYDWQLKNIHDILLSHANDLIKQTPLNGGEGM